MNERIKNSKAQSDNNEIEISCGNCWGHQEYHDGYEDKSIDLTRGKGDNFLSRFVKKYLK